MFAPSPSTMNYAQLYGGRSGGGTSAPATVQTASGGAAPMGATEGSAHVAWLGIVVALVVIRVMYELGAKID